MPASSDHRSRLNPMGSFASRWRRSTLTGERACRTLRAWSLKSCCSSVRTNVMALSRSRQTQDVLRDDVELHLGGAAFDGVALRSQPAAHGAVGFRAFPAQAAQTEHGHGDLLPALVELGAVVLEHGGERAGALPAFGSLRDPPHRELESDEVDLVSRDVRAQQVVGEPPALEADLPDGERAERS